MEFEKNTLLFGADPTPRIVAIELGDTGTVKVYRREEDGSTVADVEPFPSVRLVRCGCCRSWHRSGKASGDLQVRLAGHGR